MAIHLYKTSTLSTRNGTADSQVKSNLRNNLIYGQLDQLRPTMEL